MAKIISLNLNNFQGIISQDIDFAGVNVSIYGRNGTGKSTIANAIAWLLYDKPADGAKNYTPKTHGADGHIHNLDHSAEMVIEIDSGTAIALKRVYHEIYHKKRGSNIEEFDGHATDHYIDGVPITEKEYKTRVALICPPDTAKILTQPWYFAESLSKDERRRVLLEVCGDVSDKDVINATPEIADLPEILRRPGKSGDIYTVDEYRKIAAARKTEINRELQAIPSRIDEATRAMPKFADIPNIALEIDIKRKEIEAANVILTEIKKPMSNEQADANLRAEIANVQARLSENCATYKAREAEVADEYKQELRKFNNKAYEIENERTKILRLTVEKHNDLKHIKSVRMALLQEYNDTMAQVWDTKKEICPTCKQPLPVADLEKMKNDFNLTKSNKLNDLQTKGKEVNKEVIAEMENKISELEKTLSDLESERSAVTEELRKIEANAPKMPKLEDTEENIALNDTLRKLQQERENLKNKAVCETSEAIKAQEAAIESLSNELQQLQQINANKEQTEKLRIRVEELAEQEKKLARDYEQTERGLYLCELFVRAKVASLTNTINSKFSKVKFRLFKEQINGGLTDDCEVLVPGQSGAFVPWGEGANTGAKINAGLDIIKVLSLHWGTSLPIVCDNAECVSDWTDVEAQLIRLIVTTTDDKLRIEYK